RIILPLLIAAAAAIAAMFYFMNYYLDREQRRHTERRLTELAQAVQTSVDNLFLSPNHHQNFRHCFESLRLFKSLMGIKIVGPDRAILFSSEITEEGQNFNLPPDFQGCDLDSLRRIWNPARDKLIAVTPIFNRPPCAACHNHVGEVIAYITVQVASDENPLTVKRSLGMVVGSGAILVLVIIFSAFGMHFRFVKTSLRRIVEGIKEFEQGNFNARIELAETNELGTLARRINHMGDRLEQMRRELQQHHDNELERADRMASVGQLAASIAHEIRNPIAGISSAMQVLLSELPVGDERAPIFDEIIRQTQRINRAVNDLLTYARPTPPEFREGNVEEPLKRALALMEGQFKANGVQLNLKLDPHPQKALLDEQQMQQVFTNLILNALQALPDGGEVTIETGIEDGIIFIGIADNGPGISPECRTEIFKPFFTTKHRGAGLGLAISRSIVENHGGSILVETEIGSGTVFRVKLPISKKVRKYES
ncbi:MAG: ATP-binding protein, partial [Calditrichota bacterium]